MGKRSFFYDLDRALYDWAIDPSSGLTRWGSTGLLDFLVGLAVICLAGWLLYLLIGG